jgi:hypothetical protein
MTAEAGAWRRIRAAIDRRVTPRAVLLAGYVVFVIYAYPGYLTTESADQLIDGRVGAFTDWHAPAMSLIWGLVELVVTGPVGMLVLQSALVLGGAYALLRRALPARPAAISAALLLVFPPVMATLAVVHRDAQMAGWLLAGAAAVTSPRRAIRGVGLALLALACAMRDTAVFAALPIAALGFTWRDGDRGVRRAAIAVVAWAAVAIAGRGLDAALIDAPTEREAVARAVTDIVGVLRYAPPLDDAALVRELAGTGLAVQSGIQARARALTARGEALAGPDRLFDPAATPAARARLFAARRALIGAHPGAYLAARWHVLYRALGLSRATPLQPVYVAFVGDASHRASLGHRASHGRLQRVLNGQLRHLARTPLFHPSLYLAVALALLPLAALRRQHDAARLLASGIAHELALFVLAGEPEYRLSHWMITATSLAVALMIARRIATRSSHSAGPVRTRSFGGDSPVTTGARTGDQRRGTNASTSKQ